MATGTTDYQPESKAGDDPNQAVEKFSRNLRLFESLQYIAQCLQDGSLSKDIEKNWPLTSGDQLEKKLRKYKLKLNESWNEYWEWFVGQERQRLIKGITQLHKLSKRSQPSNSTIRQNTKPLEGIQDENVPPSFQQNVKMMKDLWAVLEGSEISCSADAEKLQKKRNDIRLEKKNILERCKNTRKWLEEILKYIVSIIKNKNTTFPDQWPSLHQALDQETNVKLSKKSDGQNEAEMTKLVELLQENWGFAWKCCDSEIVQLTKLLTHVHQSCFGKVVDYDVCDEMPKEFKKQADKLKNIQSEVLKKIEQRKEQKEATEENDENVHSIPQREREDIDVIFNFYEKIMIGITEFFQQNKIEGLHVLEIKEDAVSKDLLDICSSLRPLLEEHWQEHSKEQANPRRSSAQRSKKPERNINKKHASQIYDDYLVHLKKILEGKAPYSGEFPSSPPDLNQDETLIEVCRRFTMAIQEHWQQYHEHSDVRKDVIEENQSEEKKEQEDSNALQNEKERQNKPGTKNSNDDKKNQEEKSQSQNLERLQDVKRKNNPERLESKDEGIDNTVDKSQSEILDTTQEIESLKKRLDDKEKECKLYLEYCQKIYTLMQNDSAAVHDLNLEILETTSPDERNRVLRRKQIKKYLRQLHSESSRRLDHYKMQIAFYKSLNKAVCYNGMCDKKEFIPVIPDKLQGDMRLVLKTEAEDVHRTLMKVARNSDLKRTEEELQKSKEEIGILRTRLSEMAGAKLQYNNPSITDLSDPNRPTKLSEKFGELYDNEWTNAFECLTESGLTEQEAIRQLLSYLQDCYKFCKNEFNAKLKSVFELYTGDNPVSFDKFGKKYNLTEIEKKTINDSHKTCMRCVYDTNLKKFVESSGKQIAKQPALNKYVKLCFSLCWMMRMQSPPVYIHADFETGDNLDTNLLRFYTKSGTIIDYLVWPALMLYKDGSPLSKGVAQPK